jgi:hypothetical protein
MANRRISLSNLRTDGRPVADFDGIADESGETELYAPYGFASAKEGEGVLIEVQDDPDNYVALPPGGDRVAPDGTTLIYWGGTTIALTESKVTITVGGGSITMDGETIKTNMNIETTGDVKAGKISLTKHIHAGVQPGAGVTGLPK